MQQGTLSTFSVDWTGRVVERAQTQRTKEPQKQPTRGLQRPQGVDGECNTTAALSPPLSKLGKLLHRPSMPSASPRSLTLSAQLANTLACSPIPLQGQPAAHSSTHHTQKFICSSSLGSVVKGYHDVLVIFEVDQNMKCDKGKWRQIRSDSIQV